MGIDDLIRWSYIEHCWNSVLILFYFFFFLFIFLFSIPTVLMRRVLICQVTTAPKHWHAIPCGVRSEEIKSCHLEIHLEAEVHIQLIGMDFMLVVSAILIHLLFNFHVLAQGSDVESKGDRLSSSGENWFNIKMSSYQYRKSHCGDKTVVRSSYLYNEISYTGKMSSLYWIRALDSHQDDESD